MKKDDRMDLKEILDKLNSMLTGTGRKLVSWYNDGSYEENILLIFG